MPVTADKLTIEVFKTLTEYSEEVAKKMEAVVDLVSGECLKDLKTTSPLRTGLYKVGWKLKKIKTASGTSRIIYNEEYRLPHLVEFGHIDPDTGQRVDGAPHIKDVETKARKRLVSHTMRVLSRR